MLSTFTRSGGDFVKIDGDPVTIYSVYLHNIDVLSIICTMYHHRTLVILSMGYISLVKFFRLAQATCVICPNIFDLYFVH